MGPKLCPVPIFFGWDFPSSPELLAIWQWAQSKSVWRGSPSKITLLDKAPTLFSNHVLCFTFYDWKLDITQFFATILTPSLWMSIICTSLHVSKFRSPISTFIWPLAFVHPPGPQVFTSFLVWFASWLPSSVPYHITFDQTFVTSFSCILQQNSSPKSVVAVRGLRKVYAGCGRSGQCGSTARLCMDCAFPQQECSRCFAWHGLIGSTWSDRGFPWCAAS